VGRFGHLYGKGHRGWSKKIAIGTEGLAENIIFVVNNYH
jgi:hypothetical protein